MLLFFFGQKAFVNKQPIYIKHDEQPPSIIHANPRARSGINCVAWLSLDGGAPRREVPEASSMLQGEEAYCWAFGCIGGTSAPSYCSILHQ